MAISAALVKELRERTGAGMMECKKALVETNGDIEAAIEAMRKSGQAKAAKKAGRTAADGVVVIKIDDEGKRGVVVEVNCETDFVAKDANFVAFADTVGSRALESGVADVDALIDLPVGAGDAATISQAREALVTKIGENVQLRRPGSRIGVVVEMEGGDAVLGKDMAMHIAASSPVCVSADEVPADTLAKEKEIFRIQALESGKPDNIIDKIVEGRVRKYLEEVTLLGQAFVKDPDTTVEKLLKQAGAKVLRFARLEVGEGIDKKEGNFADEVMAQVRGA
jgi:elongation factor Ts